MKNTLISSTILASSLLLSTLSYANTDDANHWSVGAGRYVFTLSSDNDYENDDTFSGYNLTAGYAPNNHFQVRASYFSLENHDYNDLDSTGYDLMAYGGVGFTQRGFRGYGGAGFFSEEWKFLSVSESFSGLQLGGGIGYNWGQVALDFVIRFRQADKYEDFISESGTYVAGSGNLNVSYLF
ncbi:outer membrane beta-barrel protein [Pseudocolwellia sp. HL-MZ19]|uniref:outer membrane beta-barrel protein n=1 Tax=Pseudocolwellia sp. HL-MZ19 TaxID=3400846 RepID=UPI003CE77373